MQRAFREIENYDSEGAEGYKHLADPGPGEHGKKGMLKVGLPPQLEDGVTEQIEALLEAGEELNLDPNSGDPVGVYVFPYSYSKEGRSTSATHLVDPPDNLEVWTDATVEKLLWEGDRVVGVVTSDGRKGAYLSFSHIHHYHSYQSSTYHASLDKKLIIYRIHSTCKPRNHPLRRRNRHPQTPPPQRHRSSRLPNLPQYSYARRPPRRRRTSARPRASLNGTRNGRRYEHTICV